MKESTEQRIREYLESFRIKFTGEEKKGATVTIDDFITLYDDSSESSFFSCLSSDKNIRDCETASDKIVEDICNIIEKEEKEEKPVTILRDRDVIDKEKFLKQSQIVLLKNEILELVKEDLLFCDENQWYTEKVEEIIIKKRPKEVIKELIGRRNWVEDFSDESTGEVISIERSEVVKRGDLWLIHIH